jgi:type IV secretion system protein VirB9
MTNRVVNTNRRTYHIELRATPATYMAAVSWRYPADEFIALRAAEAERVRTAPLAGGIDLPSLSFGYRISGDKTSWRPLRVFDDGRQMFVEFAPSVAVGDMPPLFALAPTGAAELLNYRVAGRFMIVDRLVDRAELRLGSGRKARSVRIDREAARGKGRQ